MRFEVSEPASAGVVGRMSSGRALSAGLAQVRDNSALRLVFNMMPS